MASDNRTDVLDTHIDEFQKEERRPRPPGIFLSKDLCVTMSDASREMTIQLTPEQGIEWAINLILVAHQVCERNGAPRNPKLEN